MDDVIYEQHLSQNKRYANQRVCFQEMDFGRHDNYEPFSKRGKTLQISSRNKVAN